MAVFTAIGAAIAGAIGLTGTFATVGIFATSLSFAGTIVAGVIAAGLGVATSKALGLNKPAGIQQAKDPGVKVQLNPSTDRRVPVFYGKVHSGGIIIDAEIKNRNNTMVYCMVIGEKTDSGSYTVQSVKRQDQTLNFSGANVISVTDPNGTTANKIANKLRCRVFAGNAQSSVNQIFPTTGKVAAQSLMTTITTSTNYEDLVYAIFEVDYDAEEGLTSLGTITYELTNTLSEPSNVLLDYCRNTRYGAGLSNAELDLNSFNDLYDYSTAQVAYTTSGGASANHDRWKLDGMLSTYQAVKDNIDTICQGSSTYFTYDNKQGKFKVVPNRAATTAEKNAAFVFTDDNIISSIEITSTELYNLYNSIEAEYPSVEQEDQTKTVIVSTPSGDRNTNEPDNPLQSRYDMVNDAPRVHNLANIDLRQSRTSTLVTFTADYSAMVVDVGDIVKVTSATYGYTDKLFRVMKVSEVEGETGYISAKVTLLEYADSVYEHNDIQSDGALGLSGIPGWWTGIWGGNISIPIIGDIIITDPTSATANTVNSGNGNVVGSPIDYSTIDWPNVIIAGEGGQGGITSTPETPLALFPIQIPDIPGLDEIEIAMETSTNSATKIPVTNKTLVRNPLGGSWSPAEIPIVAVPIPESPPSEKDTGEPLPNLPNLENPLYNINIFGHGVGNQGRFTTLPSATVPDVSLPNKGGVPGAALASQAAGFKIDEAPAAQLLPMAGDLTYTTTGAFTGNTLTFNEEGYPNLIVGGILSGTGITPVTVITAVTGNSSITTNINVNVSSGASITINNAIATAIGEPAILIGSPHVAP